VDKSSNMYLIFFSMLSIVLFYLVILIDAHTRRTLPSVSCFRHFLFFQFKMKATGVLNNSPWRLFIQLQMFFFFTTSEIEYFFDVEKLLFRIYSTVTFIEPQVKVNIFLGTRAKPHF
jgi:hypothetical protein